MGGAVGIRTRRLGGISNHFAQLAEAFQRQFHQQRFMVGEMAIRRSMADASLAGHGAQGQL